MRLRLNCVAECWDALEEVTEEKIHIHDAEIDPNGPIKNILHV